jgi:hypothetical protein
MAFWLPVWRQIGSIDLAYPVQHGEMIEDHADFAFMVAIGRKKANSP